MPLAIPCHVGVAAISAVHCVSARTKTRSKKSSSGVTAARSRITAETRGVRGWVAVLTRGSSQVTRAGGRRASAGRAVVPAPRPAEAPLLDAGPQRAAEPAGAPVLAADQ